MPLAFSYLRFSSPEQAKGDSVRRQTEATAAWCHKHKVSLDTSLTLRDEGASAFRGKHRENPDVHGLAAFLSAVQTGRVPAGSFLVLENLDRLTREKIVPAVHLFTGLLVAGVKVVQLRPVEQVFTSGADMTAVMLALVELSRGNSESAMKSERVGSAWQDKRDTHRRGQPQPFKKENRVGGMKLLTHRLPGWIGEEDGRAVLIPEKAATVRRLFALAREGFGVGTIAQRLNEEKVPVLGRTEITRRGQRDKKPDEREKVEIKWSETVVYHLLRSRATFGEYQPCKGRGGDRRPDGDPIRDYFPAVISEDEWHAVQAAMRGRVKFRVDPSNPKKKKAVHGWPGRRGSHVNLFAGLLLDARDGGSLTYKHLSTRPACLIPVGAKAGKGTPWTSFPAVPFEVAILKRLAEVQAKDIAGDDDSGHKAEALAGRKAEVDALIRAWAAKMDNIDTVDLVTAKLAELNVKAKAMAEQLAEAQRERASPVSESWGEFRSLADLLAADGSDELRVKVRAALRRCIESVHCLFAGSGRVRYAAVQVRFRNSDKHRDYIVRYTPGYSNSHVKREGVPEVEDALWGDGADVWDFRKRSDVRKVLRWLESFAAGTHPGRNLSDAG